MSLFGLNRLRTAGPLGELAPDEYANIVRPYFDQGHIQEILEIYRESTEPDVKASIASIVYERARPNEFWFTCEMMTDAPLGAMPSVLAAMHQQAWAGPALDFSNSSALWPFLKACMDPARESLLQGGALEVLSRMLEVGWHPGDSEIESVRSVLENLTVNVQQAWSPELSMIKQQLSGT